MAHTMANVATGNTWMEFVDTERFETNTGWQKEVNFDTLPKTPDHNYKYYLTTWNNTAMIQTGHSNGNSTEDERKVLANTLFYLKQLTKKTEILDNSARDIADPNKVSNVSTIVDEVNSVHVKFRRPEDNGSTYEYYVKGLNGDTEFRSDTKSATITTGVKKYKYAITEGNTTPLNWYEIETKGENESIDIGSIAYSPDKYIHIRSIDGAGNESEVYTQKLEKPEKNQELEVKNGMRFGTVEKPGATIPILLRYFRYIGNILAKGDFGFLIDNRNNPNQHEYTTMSKLFFIPLKYSVLISFPAFVLSALIGVTFGVIAGYKHGK